MMIEKGVKGKELLDRAQAYGWRHGRYDISTERCIKRSFDIQEYKTVWKRLPRFKVREIFTYEVVGRVPGYMGWDAWAEREWSGAYWLFDNKEEAQQFIAKEYE